MTPPPPPTILKQPGRTLVGVPAASPAAGRSVPPPLPARARPSFVSGRDEDENEDEVTDIAERVTLVFNKDGIPEDESTHELPWPTLRRLPSPAVLSSSARPLPPPRAVPLPSPVPLPPTGFDVISASLAAASLPPPDFTAALARENEARMSLRRVGPLLGQTLRLPLPSLRAAGGLTAAVVVALIAFARSPGQGTIVVDASDARGGPVEHLDVYVDGQKTACPAAPCSVPGARGLHEVKVSADGFDAPATQGVAVASGNPTTVHFIFSPSVEPSRASTVPASPASAPLETVKLEPLPSDDVKASSASAVASDAKPLATAVTPAAPATRASRASVSAAYPVPAPAPAVRASRATAGAGAAGVTRGGFLNMNSIPASTCFLDGRSLGSTPRLRIEVGAGSHTVKFRAPGSGATKTVVVNVNAGETRLAVARL